MTSTCGGTQLQGIRHDATPRAQFHHVNDIAPTIYEVTKITSPRVENGVPQDPIDGVSLAYTFSDAVVLMVDSKAVGQDWVERSVLEVFIASEWLDVGVDLGSPVSLDYFDRAPFKFDGTMEKVTVELK